VFGGKVTGNHRVRTGSQGIIKRKRLDKAEREADSRFRTMLTSVSADEPENAIVESADARRR
jgi:hypothetical protein